MESSQLMAKVDDAIELERSLYESDQFDMDEPIIVNTVSAEIPFADPVQLGNDNRAPSIASLTAGHFSLDPPSVRVAAPRKFAPANPRKASAAEFLSLPLKSPGPRVMAEVPVVEENEPHQADGEGARDPLAQLGHEPSEALRRLSEVFAVDIALRCDLAVQIQMGRKKYDGVLVRLSESKLRVSSRNPPDIYQSLQLNLPDPMGGKKPFPLRVEVMRVRESENEDGPVAFDLRVAPSNKPREMNQLRALIKSYQAPGT
jgi:hypothetical protein